MDTLQRGGGDCKDLSALVYSALKSKGLSVKLGLTARQPLPLMSQQIPSMGWFDHVIVWVDKVNGNPKVIDLSGLNRSELTGNWVYLISDQDDEGEWTRIPSINYSPLSSKE